MPGKRKATSPLSNSSSKIVKFQDGISFLCIFFFLLQLNISCSSTVDPISSMKAIYAAESAQESNAGNNGDSSSSCGARVQKPAPSFSADAVVDKDFKTVSLDDYKGKYLVIFFYPLDFTFVCPTEITAFSDRAEEFRENNCEVLAISVDSKFTHLAWVNTPRSNGGLGKMNIPLVSDITKKISKDYGVLLEEGSDAGVSLRGLFIIGDNGIVRHIGINDLPVGRSVDETLRLVQAFQYTDKYGEVCPSGWKPGDLTMKANPLGSKEYFSKIFSETS